MKNSQNRNNFATFVRTVLNNPYIKSEPTFKQAEFLINGGLIEGFYGGAAGGGKSESLLSAALQYVEESRYAALLLRRSYADLSLPGALMDRAAEWLTDTDAHWKDKSKTWEFPSGSTLTFGYLEHEKDKYRYQGSEFQFVGFDELTQFTETQYTYLFSRSRRIRGSRIPIRMRSASNPGGVGHDWVKARFIAPEAAGLAQENRFFVPAQLEDNPHLDCAEYCQTLDMLDPVTKEQLRYGNWDIALQGGMFKREWFEYTDEIPDGPQVRFWDFAATKPVNGSDPDWTVGLLMSETKGQYFVRDLIRMRGNPGEVETLVKATAKMDGYKTRIVIEQEPGSSGLFVINDYARRVLKGYAFTGQRGTGSKPERARAMSAAASNHNIILPEGAVWVPNLLNELEPFPTPGIHDDQVDAMSGAFNTLAVNVGSGYAGLRGQGTKKNHIPGLTSPVRNSTGMNINNRGRKIPGL